MPEPPSQKLLTSLSSPLPQSDQYPQVTTSTTQRNHLGVNYVYQSGQGTHDRQ